jgi:hypothetical protein
VTEIAALREGVAALLEARGDAEEALIVRSAGLAALRGAQRWSVGSREVDALSFELSLDPVPFASLRALANGPQKVRDAFADAVASERTMLAELYVVLRLPGTGAAWGDVYRSAPVRAEEPPADVISVRGAAVALLRAESEEPAAELLARAELSTTEVPSSGALPLKRWVVRMRAADAATVLADPRVTEVIRRAVALAATRSSEVVASVEIGVT